jgi:hypothetical protein
LDDIDNLVDEELSRNDGNSEMGSEIDRPFSGEMDDMIDQKYVSSDYADVHQSKNGSSPRRSDSDKNGAVTKVQITSKTGSLSAKRSDDKKPGTASSGNGYTLGK